MKIEFDSVNGTKSISYFRRSTILNYPCNNELDYCAPYKVTFARGTYRIELWGASAKGKGGYTKGEIFFRKEEIFYIHIGASGGLYNSVPPYSKTNGGNKGGGATDIRCSPEVFYDFDSLKTRIMVAAGSGTWECYKGTGMNAGGLVGEDGNTVDYNRVASGANQTSGGEKTSWLYYKGTFGLAGYTNTTGDWGATGGGGYYGGMSIYNAGASGGGSSFISGYEGCDAIHENSTKEKVIHTHQPIHYSRFVFFNTVMRGGNESLPLPTKGYEQGHSGHGVARITPLIILDECRTFMKKRNNLMYSVLILNLISYK